MSNNSSRLKGSIQLLQAMSPGSIELFGEYLNFPPFNSQARLSAFFDLVNRYILQPQDWEFELESVLDEHAILPSQVPKLHTLLQQKIDQFLAFQLIEEKPHRWMPYVLDAYNQLEVDETLKEKKWKQLEKRLSSEVEGTELLFRKMELEHFFVQSQVSGPSKPGQSIFEEIQARLGQATATAHFKYLCARLNEAQLVNLPPPDLSSFASLPLPAEEDLPLLGKAYRQVLELLPSNSPDPEIIRNLAFQLKERAQEIVREDLLDLFNYFLNICYRRINLGEKPFESLGASLFRDMLDLNLIPWKGQIPPRLFKNIVSLNCRLTNYAWTLEFIDRYAPALPSPEDQFLAGYCRGLVHFYSGNHHESATIFRRIMQEDHQDQFWGFESRNLLLKSLFQRYDDLSMQEHEELLRLIDSFRMYTRRNKRLSRFHQKCYLNFIQVFNSLVRLEEASDSSHGALEELWKEIDQEELITHKEWLLAVIERRMKE